MATFAGSRSMRKNYAEAGVDGYYESHGATYRNPHYPGIVEASAAALTTWLLDLLLPAHPELPEVLATAMRDAVAAAAHSAAQSTIAASPTLCSRTARAAVLASSGLDLTQQHAAGSEEHQDLHTEQGLRQEAPPPGATRDGQLQRQPLPGEDMPLAVHTQGGVPSSSTPGPEPGRTDPAGHIQVAPCELPPPCYDCGTEQPGVGGPCIRVLDLACGSGEASQALAAWWRALCHHGVGGVPAYHGTADAHASGSGQTSGGSLEAALAPPPSLLGKPVVEVAQARDESVHASTLREGVEGDRAGHSGGTPDHQSGRSELLEDATGVSACSWQLRVHAGGGEEAGERRAPRLGLCVDAADPYTSEALRAWTGRSAETFSFQDVAAGWLLDQGRAYHLCVCSYALHVLSSTSYLATTLQQLALTCEALLVLSPHKLPHVEERTGWALVGHVVRERVHARLFRSTTLLDAAQDLQLAC